jgi:hypothetical protein
MQRKELRAQIKQALIDAGINVCTFKVTAPKSGSVDCRVYFVSEDIPNVQAQKNRISHFACTLCSTDQDLLDDISEQVQGIISGISSSIVIEAIEQDYMQQDQPFLIEVIRFRKSRIA